MTRYALGITYHGGSFHGWQRQAAVATVQGAVESALAQVADHPVELAAAGRTDRGVHACGQVGAFSSDASRSLYQWRTAVNSLTPDGIGVDWVMRVADDFHPRFDATARRYLYVFADSASEAIPNPLSTGFTWPCVGLDADLMHQAVQALLGEHDFSGFRAAGCQSQTPMRRVHHARVLRFGPWVVLDIEANAFLLHMVRNIARGLVTTSESGEVDYMRAQLQSTDRTQLGPTAPPQGLYLYRVSYPQHDFPNPLPPPLLAAMVDL
ncbi:MAG: tRNA pseudouridine(38-40) synthase TruA [Pseudomonadota bacterium]